MSRSVSLDDGGLYMCQINTDPMTSQSAWLSVQIPPDIDMARTSGDITAREHEVSQEWSVRSDDGHDDDVRTR